MQARDERAAQPSDALLARVRLGDREAEQALLLEHMPLVRAIAMRYAGRQPVDDLMQLGSIGLLKALRGFQPERGYCFSTYAVPMIAGEIRSFLRDDGMMRVSRTLKQLAYKAKQLEAEQLAQGLKPTVQSLAQALGVEAAQLAQALDAEQTPASLDAPLHEEGDGTLAHTLSAKPTVDIHDRLFLRGIMDQLPPLERRVIALRFAREWPQARIASALGISQAQVSRIETKTLTHMRALCAME